MIKLKNLLMEVEGTSPNVYYHVTFKKNIPKIKKYGILIKSKPTWSGAYGQDIREETGVFCFENYYDAIKWAFKTSWDLDDKSTVIVKFETHDSDFVKDPHWQSSIGIGRWLVKKSDVRPEDIREIVPFNKTNLTPELTKKINSLN